MNRTVLYFLLVATCVWLAACTGAIPKPGDAHHKWARLQYGADKDLDRGYTLFVANCSGCHNLPHPSAYSDSAWARVFPEMREKSKLSDGEADLVLAYISSASAVAKAHESY